MSIEPGALYVVATPIGHRDDLSPRARAVLAAVDLVAAEDTRHTGQLLAAMGIDARLTPLHEHNETERAAELVRRLQAGEALALVSDAGTPGLSDPGFPLVVAAHEAGVRVIPVPGPSAAIAALTVSGQPTDRFAFEGFLPARAGARRARLRQLAGETRTLIFHESCHRIGDALADLVEAFGPNRPATLARELTKAFETVRRSTLAELAALVADDSNQRRGEIVLVVAGAADAAATTAADIDTVLDLLLAELPPARAAAVAARLTGMPRREAYRRALGKGR